MEEIQDGSINGHMVNEQDRQQHKIQRRKDKKEKKRKKDKSDPHHRDTPSKLKKPRNDDLEAHEKLTSSLSADISPFHQTSASFYLPLSPIGQLYPLRTLCAEHISPLLLTYYQPLHGVVLSYGNPRLSANGEDPTSTDGRQKTYARSIDEYAAPFVWLTADFLVLDPQRGDVCEGYISIQNESSIGLICWNFFSASIERVRLPKDWKWISKGNTQKWKQKLKRPSQDDDMDIDEDQDGDDTTRVQSAYVEQGAGYYVDGNENKVSGLIRFRVVDVDTSAGTSREFDFMSVLGTMLSEAEEKHLRREEIERYLSTAYGRQPGRKPQGQIGNHNGGLDGAADSDGLENARHRVRY